MNSMLSLYTPRDLRNYSHFSGWMVAAVVMFAAATLLIDGKVVPPAAGWALAAGAVVLMTLALRAYMQFLRLADELLRKIHLEALALAFGVGAVTMMGYRLCERLGAPDLDINDPFLVMMLTWFLAQWVAARRYASPEEP